MSRATNPTESRGLDPLLQRAADGDGDAFLALYDATAAGVFGLAVRMLDDRAVGAEVTAHVFVEAWRTAPRYDAAGESARSWLSRLAHRIVVDEARSRTPAPTPEHDVPRGGLGRLALELIYFEGCTAPGAADRMHIPVERVYELLNEELGGRGQFSADPARPST